jgi:hypothetical protein
MVRQDAESSLVESFDAFGVLIVNRVQETAEEGHSLIGMLFFPGRCEEALPEGFARTLFTVAE